VVPSAAGTMLAIDIGSRLNVTSHDVEAKESGDEPAQRREEGECNGCLPFLAGITLESDTSPVEDVAATIADPVNKQAEGNPPEDGHDDVRWPVKVAVGEREEPKEGKENCKTGNNFGIDEAGLI